MFADMEWTQRLTEPIALDNGEVLCTLRDARKFILALPEEHRGYLKWQSLARLLFIAAQIHDPDIITIATKQLRKALSTPPFAPVRLAEGHASSFTNSHCHVRSAES